MYLNIWSIEFLQTASSTVTSISPHKIYRIPHYINPKDTISKASHGNSSYQKRPRRKAVEIERLYGCNWFGCDKAYGDLGHLNTHVRNAEHGPKRKWKGIIELFTYLINRVSTDTLRANRDVDWRARTGKKSHPYGNSFQCPAPIIVETSQKQVKSLNAFMIYKKDRQAEISASNQRPVSYTIAWCGRMNHRI